jgi:hypothetical protein
MRAVEAFMRVVPADKQATTALQLFGWPYSEDITGKIPTSILSLTAGTVRNSGRVVVTNTGVSILNQFYSNAIVLDVYETSGRLVHSAFVANSQKNGKVLMPLGMLPSGHYIGRLKYGEGCKTANGSFFNINIMR